MKSVVATALRPAFLEMGPGTAPETRAVPGLRGPQGPNARDPAKAGSLNSQVVVDD